MDERGLLLVTGATGFVGARLCEYAEEQGWRVRRAVRSAHADAVAVGEIGAMTDWSAALEGAQAVVHLAARVHVMQERAANPFDAFRSVNVDGTARLARQAAAAGVRRLVFVSSIKVNGEQTNPGSPFTAEDRPAPIDPYGVSKREAEDALRQIAAETGMEVTILRPPLVYGPGVKANFQTMMRWLSKAVPLPLGAIHNKRSLIALDNLVDVILTAVEHPRAGDQTFLASDGEDLSTTELLQRLAAALGRPARLLPVPAWMLEAAAAAVGKRDVAQRLCGSLQVDISNTRDLLDWAPVISVDEGLDRTAEHFLATQKGPHL